MWRREEERKWCFRVTADSHALYVIWIAACLGRSLCLFEYEELAAYRVRAFGPHADRHSPRHHPAKQDWPGWCSVAKPAVPPPLHRRCRPRACFTLTAGLSCVRYDNSVSSQKKQKNAQICSYRLGCHALQSCSRLRLTVRIRREVCQVLIRRQLEHEASWKRVANQTQQNAMWQKCSHLLLSFQTGRVSSSDWTRRKRVRC